ncbi:hypothetical protein HDU93_010110, partial [Gonapodya sp. JEL0774]
MSAAQPPPDSITATTASDYVDSLGRSLSVAARASAFLTPSDIPFFRAASADFNHGLSNTSAQLLALTNTLIAHAAKAHSIPSSNSRIPRFHDADDVLDAFSKAVSVIDVLLERA